MDINIALRTFSLINQERSKKGKAALTWDSSIYNLCLEHTNNMATGKVAFGHTGFSNRVSRIPFPTKGSAENVAYNYNKTDPALTVVGQWMKSQGHYNNIMGDYNVSGLACVKSSSGAYYFTQIFTKK